MHILRPEFALPAAEALAVAARRGFGLLTAFDGARPIGSHVPFVMQADPAGTTLRFHLTMANPLAALADGERSFLLVVTGPDAYVSNDFYATPDQVSTWMYEAVHLTGPARRLARADNRLHGDALLAVNEQRLAPKTPWHLDRMAPVKRDAMLDAIIGIEMQVRTIEGQRKFNQQKPDADHVAVVRALEKTGFSGAHQIAGRMRAMRPGLEY